LPNVWWIGLEFFHDGAVPDMISWLSRVSCTLFRQARKLVMPKEKAKEHASLCSRPEA
jgi:hypothetical protein